MVSIRDEQAHTQRIQFFKRLLSLCFRDCTKMYRLGDSRSSFIRPERWCSRLNFDEGLYKSKAMSLEWVWKNSFYRYTCVDYD